MIQEGVFKVDKGLLLVGKTYYFQKRIPEKLAQVLGIKIYKRSLETDSYSTAKKVVAKLHEVFDEVFREYKRPTNIFDDYTKEDLLKLLQVEFYKVIDSDKKRVVAVLEDKYLSKSRSGKKLKTLVKQYLQYLEDVKKLKVGTIRTTKGALNVVGTLCGDKAATELLNEDIKNVVDQYTKTALGSSVKIYVTKLKTFLKWIQDAEDIIIPKTIFKFLADYRAGIKSEDVRDAFTVDQLKQIFSADYIKEFKKPYYYFPLLLSFACGLRAGEAAKICVKDVIKYKDRYLIRITEGKTENAKRYVVIPREVVKLGFGLYYNKIKDNNPDSYLWEKALSHTSMGKKFSSYLIQLGIKTDMADRRYTEHSLRHSFATKMIASGVDERFAKKYFGHSGSSLMESRYLIQTPEIEDILNQVDAKLDFTEELSDLKPLFFTTEEQLIKERKHFVRKFIKENYHELEQHFNINDETTMNYYEQYYTEYKTKTLNEILLEEDPQLMVNKTDMSLVMAYLTRLKKLFKI